MEARTLKPISINWWNQYEWMENIALFCSTWSSCGFNLKKFYILWINYILTIIFVKSNYLFNSTFISKRTKLIRNDDTIQYKITIHATWQIFCDNENSYHLIDLQVHSAQTDAEFDHMLQIRDAWQFDYIYSGRANNKCMLNISSYALNTVRVLKTYYFVKVAKRSGLAIMKQI